jgi:uncharacterized phage-associated protein
MAYSSLAVANFFIEKGIAAKAVDLTPMKVQKLVYFAHGWYLAIKGEPLLTDRIQAWQYGPVIKDLYKETKKWSNSSIDCPITFFDATRLELIVPRIEDKETIEFLDSVWQAYAKHSAMKLSNATHIAGSPWDLTVKSNNGQVGWNTIIDDSLIKNYFLKLAGKTAA